jgi:acetoin utilization protein AcuB
MSAAPHTIGSEQTMALAHRMLREHGIRHLPVLHEAKLVGILSDRDLNLIESLENVDPNTVLVEDAMTPEPYVVELDADLEEVVTTMADKKYGCAVVTQNKRVIGIFTTVDVCRAFAEMLRERQQIG